MIAEETNSNNFNYVWECKEDRPLDGKTIPMRKGDYLFICVEPNGHVQFRYRKCDWRENPELCGLTESNTELWAGAEARLDKDGVIRGTLQGGERKIEMTIKAAKTGFTVHCRHFTNPEEGDWDSDDDWGGQQQ